MGQWSPKGEKGNDLYMHNSTHKKQTDTMNMHVHVRGTWGKRLRVSCRILLGGGHQRSVGFGSPQKPIGFEMDNVYALCKSYA